MTFNAKALRPFANGFIYPVAIYQEFGDRIDEYATEERLLQYIRDGLVTWYGTPKRVKRICFVNNVRKAMAKTRLQDPKYTKRLPVAGDVVKAYIDTRRKYRRSGLPRMQKCMTVLENGRTCEETITPPCV